MSVVVDHGDHVVELASIGGVSVNTHAAGQTPLPGEVLSVLPDEDGTFVLFVPYGDQWKRVGVLDGPDAVVDLFMSMLSAGQNLERP